MEWAVALVWRRAPVGHGPLSLRPAVCAPASAPPAARPSILVCPEVCSVRLQYVLTRTPEEEKYLTQ